MAEAFLNAFFGDRYEAKSAGINPTGLNPYVFRAKLGKPKTPINWAKNTRHI